MSGLYNSPRFEICAKSLGALRVLIKGDCSYFHESIKELFCCGLPTLHFGAGGLDCGLVCCVEHSGTGLEAGQGFWGDALIVVEPEYKGHWNKRPLQLSEWALYPDDKVQRLWENLFFFSSFPGDINNSVHENHQKKSFTPNGHKWRFI